MVTIINREIDNFYDIPFIGPWPLKVGKILDIMATPCDPSAEIWVKAFWHDIPFLVWAIIKPDPTDLVLNRFKVGHHRKRKRRFFVKDVFQPKFPVPKGAIGTAVFPAIQVAERVGWYLLIVDASLDFVINWTSTAYTWEGCAVPDAAWAKGRATGGTIILPPFDFGPVPCFTDRDSHIFGSFAGVLDTVVNYDVSYNLSLNYTTPDPPSPFHFDGTFEVRDYESGQVRQLSKGLRMPDGSWATSIEVKDWSATKPRHTFGFAALSDHVTHVNFDGTVHTAYGHKQKGMKFDP